MDLVLYAPSALLLYGLLVLLRGPRHPNRLAALGWLTLWVLPAVPYQCSQMITRHDVPWVDALLAAPISLWVLLGGRAVIEVFEATARDLTGHRQSTMLDNAHVYLGMTAILCAVLVWIVFRRHRPWRSDPLALLIGAAVLGSALLAVPWAWWET